MVGNLATKKTIIEELIATDDLKWCSVSLSEVMTVGKRLESTVFDVDNKHARELVANCRYSSLPLYGENGLTTAYTCARFKRVWVPVSDLPIYQPSSILDLKPTPDSFISRATNVDIESLRVRNGQILITCSGTIGKVSLVSETLNNKIFSHDLIRMDAKDPDDTGFIYTYLRSAIGSKILQSNHYGAVVTHIEPEHLSDIPVPTPPASIKKKIGMNIKRAFELRDEANELIDKAIELLKEELKLPPLQQLKTEQFKQNSNLNNFSVKLSSLTGRIDASKHVPLSKSIIEHLTSNASEVTTLGDKRISEGIFLPGRFKRTYVSENHGVKFFGIKQITTLDPMTDKFLALGQLKKSMKKELLLEEGMLLVSRSGTIGNLCIVPKHWENWIASEDLIRVRLNENVKGYVYIFLLSEYGQTLIKRFSFGSVQDHIDCAQIAQIEIPLLRNIEIQNQINQLAQEANTKRYDAYLLEKKAMKVLYDEVLNINEA